MKRTLAALGCLLAASLACNLPSFGSQPEAEVDLLQTSVAGTLVAQLTQTAAAGPTTAAPIPTEAPASSPEPLASASATQTATQTLTPTPAVPLVSVTVNTNCRAGPGVVYDYLGALLVGESAEIVGRDPSGNYWFIQNPDRAGEFCWLWGEYAQPVGNFASLPILTPPPSPTPTYTATATATQTPTHTPTP